MLAILPAAIALSFCTLLAGETDPTHTTLCALVAGSEKFSGQVVTVIATYSSTFEFATLRDDDCNPLLDTHQPILATFAAAYDVGSRAHKRLMKLVKHGKSGRVKLEGTFRDPGRFVGHQNCCRYVVEIRRLLSVEP